MSEYKGTCFCGEVEVTVSGSPVAMGFCHCDSCRAWSAAPMNGFTLWKPSDVKITKGEGNLGAYKKTETSNRKFCKSCGGHVLTDHPPWDLVDVYAAVIKDFPFDPKLHVNYAEKAVAMKDGLPKFKDVPSEMGGSGEQIAE